MTGRLKSDRDADRSRSAQGSSTGSHSRCRLLLVSCAVVLLAGIAMASVLEEFRFSKLNRRYESIVQDLAPVQVGPANVRLSSPSHHLIVHEHSVQLARGTAAGLGAALQLDVSGAGRIEADVEIGSVRSRLGDDLILPRQSLSLVGRVSVAASTDGYVIRALELPEVVSVRIESQLARQLFVLCRPMALVLVNMDCGALQESLSRIQVPLPEAGASYVLPYEELTPKERLAFERFLDG